MSTTHITITNVKARIANDVLVKLTNESGTATTVNDTRLQLICDFTNQFIDDCLRAPDGTAPLATTVTLEIALQIVYKKLYEIRAADVIPESIEKNYKEALEWLNNYKDGTKKFATTTTTAYVTNTKTQVFSSDVLAKY